MGISRALLGLCGALCVSLTGGAAAAANLYLTPEVGFLGGFVRAKGDTEGPGLQRVAIGGKNSDWTPGAGLALGIAFPMNEAVPWDVGLPEWDVRAELEAVTTADDFEHGVPGVSVLTPVRVSLESVLTSFNLGLDIPISDGISALTGQRLPAFDPVTFSIAAGLGMARNDVSVNHANDHRSNEVLGFGWQAGAGFGYQLTDRVSLTAAYRYADLGRVKANLCCVAQPDTFHVDVTQHDVLVGIRVLVYGVPSPRKWYGRW